VFVMSLGKLIEMLVGPPVKVPTKKSRLDAIRRNVRLTVASCASGNVLLQQGQFTTREELETLRAENNKYYGRSN